MQNALRILPETQTMSSLEIAKLTGKPHNDVLKDIRRILEEAEIGAGQFSRSYLSEQNKPLPCFNLPFRETNLIISGYSTKHRLVIIDKWQELEAKKPTLPTNYIEALEALVISEKANQASLVIIDNKDKLLIASSEASIKAGEILVREFVKSNDLIDLGEKQFFEWMREQNLLLTGKREPYQQFVKRGYFTWKPTEETHGGKFRYQLRVTARGQVWLAAKYMAWIDRDMAA